VGAPGHYIGRIMDRANRKPATGKPDKAERLAEALRENLRRRKAQARLRRGDAGVSENRPENDTDSSEKR